ncbi:MAG: hypothetical protein K0R65_1893 [Crocinitomicaceae bacterium]|jgi:hypothetical protein|nr:hypothetical protein [Crocinitomicaceae bacterium]
MTFPDLYALLLFLGVCFALGYFRVFRVEGLGKWDLSFAFALKGLASLFFIYIYTYYYGVGFLYFDSGFYINDAKILNQVIYKSPLDYFKLLTGIGETNELIRQHLSLTEKWSRPYSLLTDDAKNVTRISSIIHFFSFNSIYVHFIVFNLFALSGMKNIYVFFRKYITVNDRIFFFALILLPSLLFWSSGVLKEPMLIFSIGLFLKSLRISNERKILKLFLLVISLILMLNFKTYVLLACIIPFIFVIISTLIFGKKPLWVGLVTVFAFLVICLVSLPKQRQKIVDYISLKQFDFNNISMGGIYFLQENQPYAYNIQPDDYNNLEMEGDSLKIIHRTKAYIFHRTEKNGLRKIYLEADTTKKIPVLGVYHRSNSYIETTLIFSSFRQMMFNIPEALVNCLFRPFWNDPSPKFKFITILETWLLFGFLAFALFKRKKLTRMEKIVIVALILFAINLSLIIGWATPVLGAIVRYRTPVYLGILIIAFILLQPSSDLWKKKTDIS